MGRRRKNKTNRMPTPLIAKRRADWFARTHGTSTRTFFHTACLDSPTIPRVQVPTGPAAEPSGPKKSGWGDSPGGPSGDGGESKPGRRRRAADNDDDEEATDAPEPTRHAIASMDDDEPAGFIPDLEDEEEDLGKQLAVAPSLKSSRVQTIMELDEEIDMALPSASEVGVDLSVLQSFLTPQEHVLEEDVPWDVEHELQTIASDLTKEKEEREGTALTGMSSPKKKKAAAAAAAAAEQEA